MRPGMTVAPAASITVSASPSRPRPTAAIRPSSMAMASPSSSGSATSPDTICPMFTMSVFTRASHAEIGAAERLVGEQIGHRPAEPDHAALDDIGPVGEAGGELQVLLRQHDGEALALEGGDLLPERPDDDRAY